MTRNLSGESSGIDEEDISRAKGMYGGSDYEEQVFPNAVHHFKIWTNPKGQARVIYNYKVKGNNIRFLKQTRKKK